MFMKFFPYFVILIWFLFFWKTQIDCPFERGDSPCNIILSFANLFGNSLRVYVLFDFDNFGWWQWSHLTFNQSIEILILGFSSFLSSTQRPSNVCHATIVSYHCHPGKYPCLYELSILYIHVISFFFSIPWAASLGFFFSVYNQCHFHHDLMVFGSFFFSFVGNTNWLSLSETPHPIFLQITSGTPSECMFSLIQSLDGSRAIRHLINQLKYWS